MPLKTLLFLLCLIPHLAFATDYQPDESLVYKTIGETELKLHLFVPEDRQATDQRPVIVFFFGGGWVGGTPAQFYQQADFFATQGLVAISAEYRVAKQHNTTPFDAVEDAKSAIRWVRQHAAELGIDPNRIVASGGSAGGHIAGCSGVIEGLDNPEEDLAISSKPNAMMLYNPVLDTTERGYGLKKVGEARKTEVSLPHQIHPSIVPTLLCHGTADKVVPYENAERFARLMAEAGNRCDLKSYQDHGHGFFNSLFFRSKTKDATPYHQVMVNSVEFLQSLGYLEGGYNPAPNL